MNIVKIGVPSVIADNDTQYMSYLFKVIQKVDPEADITIAKTITGYNFLVTPSLGRLRDKLILEIKEMHFILGLNVKFSSLNVTTSIAFYMV
jgi:hypothetical protein